MAAGDLTTVERVKEYLGSDIADSAADALLARLVTAASDWIRTATGRDFEQKNYTERCDGNGKAELYPRRYPVISVSSVKVGADAIPAQSDISAQGWVLSGDRVALVGYAFTRGVANVEIVYSAGYATIPADVEQAVIELVAYRYKARERISIANRSLASGETLSFVGYQASTASVDAVIQKYAWVGIA